MKEASMQYAFLVKLYLIPGIKNNSLSFDAWKKMMEEQNRIINEAFRSKSQMLNDAIKEFSENNPKMIINAIQQQAEIFNQIIQQQGRIFADAMKQLDEKKTQTLQNGTDPSSNVNNEKKQKRKGTCFFRK